MAAIKGGKHWPGKKKSDRGRAQTQAGGEARKETG